jgi:hypothetical protein
VLAACGAGLDACGVEVLINNVAESLESTHKQPKPLIGNYYPIY